MVCGVGQRVLLTARFYISRSPSFRTTLPEDVEEEPSDSPNTTREIWRLGDDADGLEELDGRLRLWDAEVPWMNAE
jgi:hypothetical protein